MTQALEKLEELQNFQFPLFLESGTLKDWELTQKLPLALFLKHEGHKVKLKRRIYTLKIANYQNPTDVLRLNISSWRGLALDAVHWYGNLIFPNIDFINSKGHGVSGYGIPHTLHQVELHRQIYQKEINADKDRFSSYRDGDWTECFTSKEEIKERALFISEKHFPGFRLILPRDNC